MNKILTLTLFLTALVFTGIAQSQSIEAVDGAQITFAENTKDFGDITVGDVVEHTFKFENTGKQPLIISNVLVQCGCTATSWPRDPIAPGKSSEIVVKFNSANKSPGIQNKVVTVVSNSVNPREKVSIRANLLPKKKDGA